MELGFGGLLNKVELLVARSKQYRSKGVQSLVDFSVFFFFMLLLKGEKPLSLLKYKIFSMLCSNF